MINVILAVDKNGGIGKEGILPWKIKEELNIFKEKTSNSIVIVGRKTLETLPYLKDRTIFCVAKKIKTLKNDKNDKNFCFLFESIEEAINEAKKFNKNIYVIGGGQIYNYIFEHFKEQLTVHISILKEQYDCDIYFDLKNLEDFYIKKEEDYDNFSHYEMIYQQYGEYQYLKLIKELFYTGNKRKTRNGYTISDFSKHLKFDLRNGFPLLTTKRMFLKGIIEELLFFIRGDTNSKILEEKGINIWKGNTSRKFLDDNGFLYRTEGEMGPMYGFQWRNFNKFYGDGVNTINNKDLYGIDQLKNVIDKIKTNPTSRRILLTTYNPAQVDLGVLYPCHSITIQFYVEDKFLDMFCYNRSSDVGLGLPFNIASSSLLLIIIASITNLVPRFFNLTLGDAHIYSDHIDSLLEQVNRRPYVSPIMSLPRFTNLEEVSELEHKDFTVMFYNYHSNIKMTMIP